MTTQMNELQPARLFADHEHRDLVRGMNRIHDVACSIGHDADPDVSIHVLDVLGWLDNILEPHLVWEDRWLYPEIDARVGTRWATRPARFDHQQIRAVTDRIRADRATLRETPGFGHDELRCHLFGLEAILRAHIEREERFLLPILDEPAAGPPD
jgi:iron-sulfur cluster repair protein YtfE (RIC family)